MKIDKPVVWMKWDKIINEFFFIQKVAHMLLKYTVLAYCNYKFYQIGLSIMFIEKILNLIV